MLNIAFVAGWGAIVVAVLLASDPGALRRPDLADSIFAGVGAALVGLVLVCGSGVIG